MQSWHQTKSVPYSCRLPHSKSVDRMQSECHTRKYLLPFLFLCSLSFSIPDFPLLTWEQQAVALSLHYSLNTTVEISYVCARADMHMPTEIKHRTSRHFMTVIIPGQFLFLFFILAHHSISYQGWLWTYTVAQAGLENTILIPHILRELGYKICLSVV